ncbi:DUF1648 domain-containing protein [Lacticaseibacillus brantae]|uniref:Integral membrane protein n=1 Tax=Lacticaseibacillus brantae DSM 23927 TaxID=1423727 RepID=A0A0R2B876_9LACO|nr:DUF1648 domain-containing protein [Lacticaseibacillus brantae]KRM71724.1 integral membrane protein [Lacticaseibacillus brantae DSM 23927]
MNKTWKTLIISSLIILAPIIYGLSEYQALPDRMVIHFNYMNQPDQWAAKPIVVFGIPIMMLLLQWFAVGITSLRSKGQAPAPRFERVVYSIIPILTVVLYITMIRFSLGQAMDIRRIALFIIGLIFLSMGNYLPTIPADSGLMNAHWPRIKNQAVWRRLNRVLGYSFVGGGLLVLLSLFFSPIISVIFLGIFLIWLFGILLYSVRIAIKTQ